MVIRLAVALVLLFTLIPAPASAQQDYPVFAAWKQGRPARVCAEGIEAQYAVAEWTIGLLRYTPGFVFASDNCDLRVIQTNDPIGNCGRDGLEGCYWYDGRAYGINKMALVHEIGHALGMEHESSFPCQPYPMYQDVMNVLMRYACWSAGY